MRKTLFRGLPLLLILLCLSGCGAIGEKAASQSIIYLAAAILSLLLLVACCLLVRTNNPWFILLFSSVLVVNIGYAFLSMSTSLQMALWANRVAYLGSVFLPLSMLMIIMNVTNTPHPKWLRVALGVLSMGVFLIAASPGILDIYYKQVTFKIVDGVSTLVKEYGVLHPLYLFYLLGYFSAMVTVIIRAAAKKTIDTTAHAIILAIAVFVNLGVWLIEQLSTFDFEMLAISYIISEMFLLGVHLVMRENQRLKALVTVKEEIVQPVPDTVEPQKPDDISAADKQCFINGLETLTPTERLIYEAYLRGASTKDIMSELSIKENTLKFHNKNLYSKLGVPSRKQLLKVYHALNTNEVG